MGDKKNNCEEFSVFVCPIAGHASCCFAEFIGDEYNCRFRNHEEYPYNCTNPKAINEAKRLEGER